MRSGEWFFDPEAKEARVFARPRKSCVDEELGLSGSEAGPAPENVAREGDGEKLAEDVES